ncbi:MAG: NAD-dependent epimerase/dehydratase family protein [Chloroflexota bacterium]
MTSPRHILVTGAGGFLGRHLVEQLCRDGHWVVAFDQSLGDRSLGADSPALDGRLLQVQGDVADQALLESIARDQRLDGIVHLAALLTDECARNPAAAISVNCQGTAAVFAAAARTGARRVIFASSMAALGDGPGAGDLQCLAPASVYGATKAFGEHLARALALEDPGLDLLGLRFGWVYGQGRTRGWSELQRMIEGFALEREEVICPTYNGGLSTAMDWTYVDDAVAAIDRCLASPRASVPSYNISGDRRPVEDAVAHLSQRFPRVKVVWQPAVRPPAAWDFQSDRIMAEAGFTARVRLEEGLDRTSDSVRLAHGLPALFAQDLLTRERRS